MEFLDLKKTYGYQGLSYEDLEWLSVSLDHNFGVYDLTPDSLALFRDRLLDNQVLRQDYLTAKMGLNPAISSEVQQALQIYVDKGLIFGETMSYAGYFCEMNQSLRYQEYDACVLRSAWMINHEIMSHSQPHYHTEFLY